MTDRLDKTIAAWLALFLFGIYLLSFSGQLYSQDSMSMFSVTESFVKRGEFSTDQLWTLFKARNEIASDGESYSKYGYGMSLFIAPLYALALALPGDLGLVQTPLLTSSIVIALSGALVFLAARRLRFSRGVSVVTALLFGLATPAWVYAKQLWSEPYSLFTLFAAFYFLLCFRDERHVRDAFIAGGALGLAVATRVTNAALVPFFAWYGFVGANEFAATTSPSPPSRASSAGEVPVLNRVKDRLCTVVGAVSNCCNLRGIAWFVLTLALVAFSIAWYDWVRYGNPFATGYRADETFSTPILLGLYGLLFSPGKGLFVYVPLLATLALALPMFYRRARRETLLILTIFALCLVTFSTWYYWWGGTNWGPRFLVPMLPFLVLAVAPAVELAATNCHAERSEASRLRNNKTPFGVAQGRLRSAQSDRANSRMCAVFASIFCALCLFAFAFELIGISIPALAYRQRMVRLSANPEWDAIFLPQFSPLVGYFNLIKPTVLDFAWIRLGDGGVSVDWLVAVLAITFITFCGVLLLVTMADRRPLTTDRYSVSAVVLLAITLALFSMYRYRDDTRFGGGDGYRALLQTIQSDEQSRDVLILNDDARAILFQRKSRVDALVWLEPRSQTVRRRDARAAHAPRTKIRTHLVRVRRCECRSA